MQFRCILIFKHIVALSQFNTLSIYYHILAAKPMFKASVKPDVYSFTSSSVRVGWPRASNIPAGLEGHYHYMLWLQVDGEREKNVTRVEQGAGEQRMEAQITGLTFNKTYSLYVKPYRELNGEHEGGASTGVVTFKSRCIGMFICI